jgi:hypothetical protein
MGQVSGAAPRGGCQHDPADDDARFKIVENTSG